MSKQRGLSDEKLDGVVGRYLKFDGVHGGFAFGPIPMTRKKLSVGINTNEYN
jgi:hypothetical protein